MDDPTVDILRGISVLDLTHFASGPVTTMVLGDLGADVLKLEAPGGEPGRRLGVTFPGGWSTFFLALNRNKKSLCVDYRSDRGQELIRRIACRVDIVVENSRPGYWKKYQLDYASIAESNPTVIYGSISGFGQDGPKSGWVSMDPIAQATGGLMALTGAAETGPAKVGAAVSDVESGRSLAFAILAALYERERTGRGQWVTTSLYDTVLGMLSMREVEYQFSRELPTLNGTAHGQIVPGQAFETSDGSVMLTLYTDEHFGRWAELMGCPGLATDARFLTNELRRANDVACVGAVQEVLRHHTTEEVLTRLGGHVPVGEIAEMPKLLSDEQLERNGSWVDFDQPGVGRVRAVGLPVGLGGRGVEVRHVPPRLGEHSRSILQGYADISEDEYATLVAEKIVTAD